MKRLLLTIVFATYLVLPAAAQADAHGTILAGSDQVHSFTNTNAIGQAEAFSFTASAGGAFDALHVFLDATNTASAVKIGIYSSNTSTTPDTPGALIAACEISSPQEDAWNACAASGSLAYGDKYWLGIVQPVGSSGNLKFRSLNGEGPSDSFTTLQTSNTTLPDPFTYPPGGHWEGRSPASMYASRAGEVTLFGDVTPGTPDAGSDIALNLGLKFHATTDGSVNGVRFYKGTGNTSTHVGRLFDSSGAVLASGTFSGESADGWQTLRFSSPVAITADTTYYVAYYTSNGHYAADRYYGWPHSANGIVGEAGTFCDATSNTSCLPTSVYNASNYYVDVVFQPVLDVTPPETTIGFAPDGSTGTASYTFSSSEDGSSFQCKVDSGSWGTCASPKNITGLSNGSHTFWVRAVDPTGNVDPSPSSRTLDVGASSACSTAANVTGGTDPWSGCFPGPRNTGVPDDTQLSLYTGPSTITTANTVINGKTIEGDLTIAATGVEITNSYVSGHVWIDDPNTNASFTIEDSTINAGRVDTRIDPYGKSSIGKSHFVATRVETYGGIRGVWCEYDCTIQHSWIHGQDEDEGGAAHQSGIRMGSGSTGNGQLIHHNTVVCDAPDVAPDGGCSADLTGYGDFAPIQNNTVTKNLFLATPGGTCTYGGSSGSGGLKPYGHLANHNVFTDNVYQKTSALQASGTCGTWFGMADYDGNRPGNQWSGNIWDDGTAYNNPG